MPIHSIRVDDQSIEDNPELAAQHEIQRKEAIEKNSVEFPEGRKLLEMLDFKTIRELFEGEYKKMGRDPSELPFVGRNEIYFCDTVLVGGEESAIYSASYHAIFLSKDFVANILESCRKGAAEKKLDESLALKNAALFLMQTVVHEETHAISATSINLRQGVPTGHHGFGKYIFGVKTNTLFDEGATEKWARELSAEYVVREGTSALKNFFADFDPSSEEILKRRYAMAEHFINSFIHRVAEMVGLSDDVVWSALKREKVEGGAVSLDFFLWLLSMDEETKEFFPKGTIEKIERDLLPELLAEWNDPKIVSCLKLNSPEESTET